MLSTKKIFGFAILQIICFTDLRGKIISPSKAEPAFQISEDIDLILDWQLLGYEKNEPWLERNKAKQDKFNKEANKRAEDFLLHEF